jgi:DeoR/GlpR family transcriptional regulator of sugar metabolism
MLAIERHKYILDILSKNGQATTTELCKNLGVSPATIRNDLTKLEKDNLIYKTHGGATLIDSKANLNISNSFATNVFSFETRESNNSHEKHAISEKALEYIKDDQCILLDASSTALTLAKKLNGFKRLTVVTNGIYSMLELKKVPNITVIFIGGIVTKSSGSIEGLLGADLLNHINADLAFISANGVTLNEGLTDFNIYEVELKKEMLKHCKRNIALLDYSKFENISTASFCKAQDINLILTDENTDKDLINLYNSNEIKIEVCPYIK